MLVAAPAGDDVGFVLPGEVPVDARVETAVLGDGRHVDVVGVAVKQAELPLAPVELFDPGGPDHQGDPRQYVRLEVTDGPPQPLPVHLPLEGLEPPGRSRDPLPHPGPVVPVLEVGRTPLQQVPDAPLEIHQAPVHVAVDLPLPVLRGKRKRLPGLGQPGIPEVRVLLDRGRR